MIESIWSRSAAAATARPANRCHRGGSGYTPVYTGLFSSNSYCTLVHNTFYTIKYNSIVNTIGVNDTGEYCAARAAGGSCTRSLIGHTVTGAEAFAPVRSNHGGAATADFPFSPSFGLQQLCCVITTAAAHTSVPGWPTDRRRDGCASETEVAILFVFFFYTTCPTETDDDGSRRRQVSWCARSVRSPSPLQLLARRRVCVRVCVCVFVRACTPSVSPISVCLCVCVYFVKSIALCVRCRRPPFLIVFFSSRLAGCRSCEKSLSLIIVVVSRAWGRTYRFALKGWIQLPAV